MQYEGQICRPPMERASYMLPVAVGCSYNACRFCMLFRHLRWRELPLKQIEADEKIDDLKKCGIVFGIAHSKNGREYISFEIIEDEQSELPF